MRGDSQLVGGRCLAQGHLDTPQLGGAGDQTSNLTVTGQPAVPPEPHATAGRARTDWLGRGGGEGRESLWRAMACWRSIVMLHSRGPWAMFPTVSCDVPSVHTLTLMCCCFMSPECIQRHAHTWTHIHTHRRKATASTTLQKDGHTSTQMHDALNKIFVNTVI